MRTFARIDSGLIAEIFPTPDYPQELIPGDGDIRSLFHPSIEWVEITGIEPYPAVKWTYAAGIFVAPRPHVPPPDLVLVENKTSRDALLDMATRAINPLLDAVESGAATDKEIKALAALKSFRIEVNRVNLTEINPTWPALPE